jgi:tRNA (guanine-N7-)-methyltransferase
MYANSKNIQTAQTGPHEKLAELVARHRDNTFRKPCAPWNIAAFDAAMARWPRQSPLILDSGCGVGWSTLALAQQNPDHFVLGVDQSEDRLERRKPGDWPENMMFVRADLVDFWRLLAEQGVVLAQHYILYPNPWPKISQVSRRWHAHPVFPTLLRLGGRLECRSNWRIYVEELAQALTLLTRQAVDVADWLPETPLTAFERKYMDSGQALYRLCCQLPNP